MMMGVNGIIDAVQIIDGGHNCDDPYSLNYNTLRVRLFGIFIGNPTVRISFSHLQKP